MYLSSTEINKRVDEVIADSDESNSPFNREEQVRVCSIDLRVHHIFWKQRKLRKWLRTIPFDLGATGINEISPRRLWKKTLVEKHGTIKLKPGEMLLGRTCEKITMPKNLVGKINTRSSYARIGLSTACNCDLVNPGYEGHVPLELTNCSPNTIIIHPYLPLCQLFLMPVSGEIDDSYSSGKYNSKYLDDDGGPSVWWRDSLVEKIVANNLQSQISETVVRGILEQCSDMDDRGFDRLQKFVGAKRFESSSDLLSKFGRSEKRKRNLYKIYKALINSALPTLLILSVSQLQVKVLTEGQSPDIISWIIWGLLLITSPFSIHSFFSKKIKFFDQVRPLHD